MANQTNQVVDAYKDFYAGKDTEWRMLGAKYKARNIIEVSGEIRPRKVLEVGAGDGSILHFLNEANFAPELYAIEISDSGIEVIKERGLRNLKEVFKFDGYTIPYADNTFDLVILAHVLEHVEHERMLLRELKRVAKYVLVEVPLDYRFGVDKRMKHFLDYGHINMYTPTLLRFLLQSEGLEVLSDKTSLISTEITRFNEFINRGQSKRFGKVLKIELEYRIKNLLGNFLGKKKKEQFANAYTVLTKKSEQTLQIL